jgi:uncharacterized membrane protein YeaQ/YmgE (transglycosylase-associated protein family)
MDLLAEEERDDIASAFRFASSFMSSELVTLIFSSVLYRVRTTFLEISERLTHAMRLVTNDTQDFGLRRSVKGDFTMSFLAWLILGLIAGFIGSKLVNKSGSGLFLDIILGIVGAVVGGFLFSFFGASGVNGLNLYSLLVAVVGSVLVLVIYHALVRPRSSTL